MKNYLLCCSLILFTFACQDKIDRPASVLKEYNLPYDNNTPAALLVQEQLDAYNKKDLDAYLIPYSDSVKVHNTLTELSYIGKEEMKQVYARWFAGLDSLHCKLINRITSGNTIIDHEDLIYRRNGSQVIQKSEAIAIYKVYGGKIQEVYFTNP